VRPKLAVGIVLTMTVQPAEVHGPDIVAGEGVGCCPLQPEPEIDAVTLAETLVGVMVPVTVPLMEQLLHARPENGMENVPVPLTTVVPAELGEIHPGGPGGLDSGTLALIEYLQVPAVTMMPVGVGVGVGAGVLPLSLHADAKITSRTTQPRLNIGINTLPDDE
jgi:hypothetical protein